MPVAVNLHYPAELAVRRGVGVVRQRPDRQRRPELLVTPFVLGFVKLGLPKRSLKSREKVRYRLGIIPDVCARAMAAACRIAAALETPQPAVDLTQDGRRFQDSQIRRDRLDDLIGQCRIVKTIAESPALFAKLVIIFPPVIGELVNVLELTGIPGSVGLRTASRRTRHGIISALPALAVFTQPHIGFADIPAEHKPDGFLFIRFDLQGDKYRPAGTGIAVGERSFFIAFSVLRILPRHSQCVEPSAPEPCAVDLGVGSIHKGRECSLDSGAVGLRGLIKNKTVFGFHSLVIAHRWRRPRYPRRRHEVSTVERVDRFDGLIRRICESVFEGGDRQARIVRIGRCKRTPRRDGDFQRYLVICESYFCKWKTRPKDRLIESRQAESLAGRAVAAVGISEVFPLGQRPFENPGDIGCAFYADRRKNAGLVENFRLIANRNVTDRAGAFDTDHPSADPAERKRRAI